MRRLLLCLSLVFVLVPGNLPRADTGRPTTLRSIKDDGRPLPSAARMEKLAKTDPIAFLENCLKRYDRQVKGYRCIMQKQERSGGRLQPTEVIAVDFREKPFSVRFDWKQGIRRAKRALYVKGENGGMVLVKPAGLAALVGIVKRSPDGPEARKAGRYPISEFGIKIGTERTLGAWERAQKDGDLHVEYLGVRRIKELNNRPCYTFRRRGYKKPEEDGVTDFTMYVDQETWLQTGSVLKGVGGKLIGEYYFRDVKLNPDFAPGTFTAAGLK